MVLPIFRVSATHVVIEELEFCESKRNDDSAPGEFMNIPEDSPEEVPFVSERLCENRT